MTFASFAINFERRNQWLIGNERVSNDYNYKCNVNIYAFFPLAFLIKSNQLKIASFSFKLSKKLLSIIAQLFT